jgi:two-component system, LuxR family, sensor kinase FixL
LPKGSSTRPLRKTAPAQGPRAPHRDGRGKRGGHAPYDFPDPAFQSLLLALSAAFARLSAGDVDQQIQEWLGKVARLTDVDRATLWRYSADGKTLHLRHFVSLSGSSAPSSNLPITRFPWLTEQSFGGRVIAWTRIPEEIPSEALEERAYATSSGASALLSIPVLSGSSLYVLSMTCRAPRRTWSPSLIFGLRLVAGIFANALERASAETSLLAMQERHRAVLRALPDMLFVISADGCYLDYYGKDDSDLLVEPAAFLGRSIDEILPPDVVRAMRPSLERVSQRDEVVTHEFVLTVRGRVQHFEARLVRRDDGAIVSIVRNTTDAIQRRGEIERLRLELTHAGRAALLGHLTASLAHELQQPIAAVVANAEAAWLRLQAEHPDPEELQLILSDISESAVRAGEQIKRVHGYLRKDRLPHRRVDLNRLAMEVSKVIQSELRMREVLLSLELGEALPEVLGDPIEIQQVILNLLLNGAEAMARSPALQRALTLRTLVVKGKVCLSVCDRGPGVAPADLKRLFEPFYSTKPEGIGMGLSISSEIIRAHGGALRAELLQTGGMHFYFSLTPAPVEQGNDQLAGAILG